jgi:hypothetical protein
MHSFWCMCVCACVRVCVCCMWQLDCKLVLLVCTCMDEVFLPAPPSNPHPLSNQLNQHPLHPPLYPCALVICIHWLPPALSTPWLPLCLPFPWWHPFPWLLPFPWLPRSLCYCFILGYCFFFGYCISFGCLGWQSPKHPLYLSDSSPSPFTRPSSASPTGSFGRVSKS